MHHLLLIRAIQSHITQTIEKEQVTTTEQFQKSIVFRDSLNCLDQSGLNHKGGNKASLDSGAA